ncbi:substrate-binding periplasmic protein [Kiloniella majae]|uniref:substrate-binding periplasmic protein n=1 Tax=Kiloniella majae TaxID=1938558 RepID=UPI000A278BF8|nr:transporter substrate-binding domain-containing protein [Kiloniella majae]
MVLFNKVKSFLTFALVLFLGFIPHYTKAESKQITACYDGWEPFYYANSEHEAGGIVVTLLNEIARETGYEIEYRLLPFKRCMKQVSQGKIDILMVTGFTTDVLMGRTSLVTWQIGAIVRKDYPKNHITDLSEFKGKKVLQVQEYEYPEIIRDFAPYWRVSKVGYFNGDDLDVVPHAFSMVENGQVVTFLEDIIFSEKIIKDNDLDLKVLKPAVAFEKNYLAYALGREELYVKFENALRARAEDGRLDQFYKDTLGQSWSELGNEVDSDSKLF